MKGFCLTVLLCAFVQVQCLTPHVFSQQSHYGLFTSSTHLLQDATITVQFDQEFQDRDCSVGSKCVSISTTDTLVSVDSGVVTVDTEKRTVSFTPQVDVPADYTSEVSITFIVPAGAFLTESGTSSLESTPYTVHAGGKLEGSVTWETESATKTVIAKISYNRHTYSVADGHEAEQPFELSTQAVGGSPTTNIRDLKYAHFGESWQYYGTAESDTEACVNAADPGAVLRDVYGNTVDGTEFAESCTTVKYFCGDFGEWSTCRYTCKPEAYDEQFNTQSRTRESINGGVCEEATQETRQCETKNVDCYIQIQPGETGNECDAAQLGCNGGTAPSGCKCSADCVENGNCCQSYFKAENTCVANPSDPDYAYLYSTCWQVSKCGVGDSDCADKFVVKDGECPIENSDPAQTRTFKYACMCTLTGVDCGNFQGLDYCCGGKSNFDEQCIST